MPRRLSTMLLLLMVSAQMAVVMAPAARAQTASPEFTIVKIRVPKLDVFDAQGRKLSEPLDASQVPLPLPVLQRSSNGRLLVDIRGQRVWIDGMYVTYEPAQKNAMPCDPGRSKLVAGATRGSGERCK